MTCFGFHCFAISKILLEIKYSDLGPGFRCTCMQRLNGPKITVEEVCNKTFEYSSYFGIQSIERTLSNKITVT